MRLPHDRLFFWLPLLLFAWAAPDLAAQTWTTVWTPDGAPVVRPAAKGDTRDYNTNCYPCKEWEDYGDGKGKWTYYPKGTKPTVCAGDTNDYVCKVCDGAGDVTNSTNIIACGNCGCCEGGNCVEYTNNCPNPLPTPTASFVKAGPCPCTSPTELGCTAPASYPIPMPNVTVCLQNCTWIPIVNSVTLEYFEGLCPNNCQNAIHSTNDVNQSNYCAVSNAINKRIGEINMPPSTASTNKLSFCFKECLQTHENIHVGQLSTEWDFYWNLIQDDIRQISIPFACETTRSESQARAEMLHSVALIMLNHYPGFLFAWQIPGRGEEEAYRAESDCLQNLANKIQLMAAENGWKCP
ncbi:MAG: hypothetical protein AB7V14_05920 [Kiritimatiellia bacterium]